MDIDHSGNGIRSIHCRRIASQCAISAIAFIGTTEKSKNVPEAPPDTHLSPSKKVSVASGPSPDKLNPRPKNVLFPSCGAPTILPYKLETGLTELKFSGKSSDSSETVAAPDCAIAS